MFSVEKKLLMWPACWMIIRVLHIVYHFKHFDFNQNKFQEMSIRQAAAYRQILKNIVLL